MRRVGRAMVMSSATDRYMFLGPDETWRMKRRELSTVVDDDEQEG